MGNEWRSGEWPVSCPRVSKDRLKLSVQLTGLSEKSINPQQEQVKQWTLALKYYGLVRGTTDKIRGFEGLRQQGLSKDTTFITRAASLLSLSTAFFPFDAQVIAKLQ